MLFRFCRQLGNGAYHLKSKQDFGFYWTNRFLNIPNKVGDLNLNTPKVED